MWNYLHYSEAVIMEDGMFHTKVSILSEHYGFTVGLLICEKCDVVHKDNKCPLDKEKPNEINLDE
jgi:hypothetical protein